MRRRKSRSALNVQRSANEYGGDVWLLSSSLKMLMTVMVMVVDNRATVVVARGDVEHLACHCSSVKIKAFGKRWMSTWFVSKVTKRHRRK